MTTPPTRSALVVLNSGSGTGSAPDVRPTLEAQFVAAGVGVSFVTLDPALNLDDAVDRHIADGGTLVVAAGGDGTVNAVANALSSLGVEPDILPITPARLWGMVRERQLAVGSGQ